MCKGKCECGADAKPCTGTLRRGHEPTSEEQAICTDCGRTEKDSKKVGQKCGGLVCNRTTTPTDICPAIKDQGFAEV